MARIECVPATSLSSSSSSSSFLQDGMDTGNGSYHSTGVQTNRAEKYITFSSSSFLKASGRVENEDRYFARFEMNS